MEAERSVHSSAVFFHSEPQLDLLAPCGMMPKDPIGGRPFMLRAIMPRRKGSPSAPESDVAVKIRDARSQLAGSHKGVERLVEKHARIRSHLVREVAAQRSFARIWIVGRADFGKQQQPRVVQRERRQHDRRGGLEELLTVLAGELDSGGASVLVHDAPHPASRALCEILASPYPRP